MKTIGIRNAKPRAYREVLEKYIHNMNTPVDDERYQSRPEQEDIDTGEERQGPCRDRDTEEAAGHYEGKLKDILYRIKGTVGVLLLFLG